jgi:hypothetical protein
MSPEEQAELAPPPTAARRRRTRVVAGSAPRPTFEVIADTLRAHRGRILMDCRWYCVCGWTSSRNADGLGNHVEQGETEGRTHQAEQVEAALQRNAQEETQ